MFDKDRNRYTVAHALCRTMLSYYENRQPQTWIFDKEEKGRPFIAQTMNPGKLDFNISHTLGMVGCAVSKQGRIGFDLEPKGRDADLEALAAKQFSLLEQQQFASAPASEKSRKFFEFWTLKESYIKLTGKGLSENLSSFSFDLAGSKPSCYVGDEILENYQFGLFDVADMHQGAWAFLPEDNKQLSPVKPDHRHFTLESFCELI